MMSDLYTFAPGTPNRPQFNCRVPLANSRQLYVVDGMIQETGKPFHFRLQPGKMMDELLQVIHVRSQQGPTSLSYANELSFGEGASGRILCCSHAFTGGEVSTDETTRIILQENACAEIIVMQHEHNQAHHKTRYQIRQAAGSQLKMVFLSLQGADIENEIEVQLEGEHANCDLSGLYLADGQQHIANRINLYHRVPECHSSQLFKGILDDQAIGHFSGKITVVPDAQRTDAFQANHNLVLSQKARIHTDPQLEIYADDVKCSHGATIGRLQPEELFYLRSRGIPRKEAELLQQLAFAYAVLEKIPNEILRERMMEMVEKRLRGDC